MFHRFSRWLQKLGFSDERDAKAGCVPEREAPPAQQQQHPPQQQALQSQQHERPTPAPGAASLPSAHEPHSHSRQSRPSTSAAGPTPAEPAASTSTAELQRTPGENREDFFAEYGESNRYSIIEIIGRGSYGIVCSAVDNYTGERVAIKKITNVFEHVSDATRILREIKLLRLLKHPDIVKILHIMLPPTPRDFKDIYVVFELMETDLHQVIKANDDLTPQHHQFFLYQMLRGLKYIHSAKVFHRDLKPKNILANADCKLKICDFGLARPAFDNMPTTIFWTDYVATRWYRAPELCGSFFAKYSPAIDIWGVGCIFAEVLLGRPLFPGKNVVNQLELITDLLGTPSPEVVVKVRNEKARRFLLNLPPKTGVPFTQVFLGADRKGLQLLKAMLSFDPAERPTAEEALEHPYFQGLHNPAREPITAPVSKLAFEFDRRKLTNEEVRELIYQEILEYHPAMLAAHLSGNNRSTFSHPSALDNFKRQFLHLENNPGAILEPGYKGRGRQSVGSAIAKQQIPGHHHHGQGHGQQAQQGQREQRRPSREQEQQRVQGQASGSAAEAVARDGQGAAVARSRPEERSSGGKQAAVASAQQQQQQQQQQRRPPCHADTRPGAGDATTAAAGRPVQGQRASDVAADEEVQVGGAGAGDRASGGRQGAAAREPDGGVSGLSDQALQQQQQYRTTSGRHSLQLNRCSDHEQDERASAPARQEQQQRQQQQQQQQQRKQLQETAGGVAEGIMYRRASTPAALGDAALASNPFLAAALEHDGPVSQMAAQQGQGPLSLAVLPASPKPQQHHQFGVHAAGSAAAGAALAAGACGCAAAWAAAAG